MSIFSDDWRECLREQYKSVIKTADYVTLPSLTAVMQRVGFGEDELRQLRLEATMRAEDLPDDFVPDMQILDAAAEVQPEAPLSEAHPLECQCPSCMELNRVPHDEDGQPLSGDDLLEYEERRQYESDDDDAPSQLSLF